MFENCVPPLFFWRELRVEKKIRHATKPVWRGRRRKKTKKKEKERNSNRKKFVIHCLKEAHKVRRRSKKISFLFSFAENNGRRAARLAHDLPSSFLFAARA